MQIIPHLPAPTAIHDPLFGHAARAARTAPPRIGTPVDQGREEAEVSGRLHGAAAGVGEYGAASLFFAQQFAQEDVPHSGAGVIHERAVSAYPSLSFDGDIFLPGQAVPLDWTGGPRLDIRV